MLRCNKKPPKLSEIDLYQPLLKQGQEATHDHECESVVVVCAHGGSAAMLAVDKPENVCSRIIDHLGETTRKHVGNLQT